MDNMKYINAFCFGMPKCGSTTVSSLLGGHAEICLHNQKEPADFLRYTSEKKRLSGYRVSNRTKVLLDFTTSYGLTDNRDTFFRNIKASGLKPEDAYFFLCVRRAEDMCRSYLAHVFSRRSVNVQTEKKDVLNELRGALDASGALVRLVEEAGAKNIFVVRFDDLVKDSTQSILATNMFKWLGLEPVATSTLWENSAGSARRYPDGVDKIVGILRNTAFFRMMPREIRAPLQQLFSTDATLPANYEDLSTELFQIAMSFREAKEMNRFYETISSGPVEVSGGNLNL
ncbi:hypothetical protein ACUNV4_30105 [Granulosicoccus sp. 3-233]|uniref:hypothetical protein n=1 Tax=Granulosicoccus sp. 3-233 TaxID=3417969 RepID=UPI003D3550AB